MSSGTGDVGVSICVPTYRRPAMLRECVESTLLNTVRPLELIVSDHDFGKETQAVLASIVLPEGVSLRHVAGPELKKQSANVNALLELASHERVVLLHDDDMLTPGAIDVMVAAWDAQGGAVDAIYGRQHISDGAGVVDAGKTDTNDRYYFKTAAAGPQQSNLWAALVGQFPNDAMMMRRSLARQVGYPSEKEVGRIPVDFHFGVRYALASTRPFVLLHDYVAIYRVSEDSVLRSSVKAYDGHLGYEKLQQMSGLTGVEESGRQIALARFAGSAVMGYLAAGKAAPAATVLRRHLFELDKKWPVRIALVGLVCLERVGIPVLRRTGVAETAA